MPYSYTPSPVIPAASAVVPIESALAGGADGNPDRGGAGKPWLPLAPVGFLALALLFTFVRDLNTKPADVVVPPPENPFANIPTKPAEELVELHFHDENVNVSLGRAGAKEDSGAEMRRRAVWFPSMRFGLTTRPGAGRTGDVSKKLTFVENGLTNNAVVRLDGMECIFGERPFRLEDGTDVKSAGETWIGGWRDDRHLDRLGGGRKGARSVWEYSGQKVFVTQHVEVIVGQSGDLDTVLVRYEIENTDTRDHTVGLRFLLDTFIGSNDGVPFLIPGQEQLINTTFQSRRADDIPPFIQARERESFDNPGTICQIGLKVEGLEPPDRFTLGAYPDVQLSGADNRCRQEKTMWEVPLLSIQPAHTIGDRRDKADSCVAMYWNPKTVPAGGKRDVGFTYGLGYLASSKGEGKLALTSGGSFTPDGEITVTAYVLNPERGMQVTLKLPEGFRFDSDEATKPVPPLPAGKTTGSTPVSWKIRAGRSGQYTLEAETTTGLKETHTITIGPRRLFGS
jgi:hypothetical protein